MTKMYMYVIFLLIYTNVAFKDYLTSQILIFSYSVRKLQNYLTFIYLFIYLLLKDVEKRILRGIRNLILLTCDALIFITDRKNSHRDYGSVVVNLAYSPFKVWFR